MGSPTTFSFKEGKIAIFVIMYSNIRLYLFILKYVSKYRVTNGDNKVDFDAP